VTNVIKNLINYSIATPRNIKLSVITKDPPDNEVLIAALEGEADYIVTGDADLLELKSYKGIKIVLPSEFLELLGEN
jgi:putative PIN family toxin of toxin-antitoxin system